MKFLGRSLLILLALYGLVFAIGDLYLAHAQAPFWSAIVFVVVVIGIQYLIAPWLIHLVLAIDFTEELPAINREFVEQLCAERGLKVPRIGIIRSGTPNAFSFGHVPGNSRVVVTTGLLEVLSPEETNAVLAHEIGHYLLAFPTHSRVGLMRASFNSRQLEGWDRRGFRLEASALPRLRARVARLVSFPEPLVAADQPAAARPN